MTDETKAIVTKTVEATRHNLWKFFGAIFMSEKNGQQAVSYHKVLGFVLFLCCLWTWMFTGTVPPEVIEALEETEIDVPSILKVASDVPDSMLYTLWGLLGLNGVNKIATAVSKTKEG